MRKIFESAKFKKFGAIFMVACLMMSLFCVGVSAADTGVTDLTGTEWRINTVTFSGEVIRIFSDTPICSVTPSGGEAFEAYSIHLGTVYGGSSSDNAASYYGEEGSDGGNFASGDTVTFYESTASTNADLISFMEANATLLNDSSDEAFNPVYGHYISPGEYVFNDTLDFSMLPPFDYYIHMSFVSDGISFSRLNVFLNTNGVSMAFYYIDPVATALIYSGDISNFSWSNQVYRDITVLDGFYIYDPVVFQWWQSNVTRVSPGYDSNLMDGFLSAFTMIGQWISGATSSLTTMFWANNSLTFLGTLAVAGLAFAVAFLIIGLIQRFLHFRG